MLNNRMSKTNYKKIEGIISLNDFKSIIDSRSISATSLNTSFSLFMFDIKAVYSDCLTDDINLNKLVSDIIYKSTRKNSDFFTIDEQGRFLILFAENSDAHIYMPISRILDKINQNLGEFVDISIGSANCPCDGISVDELIVSVITSLTTSKNGNVLSGVKDISKLNVPEKAKQSYYDLDKNRSNYTKLNFLVDQINKYSAKLKIHSARVAMFSMNLAQELNFNWKDIEIIAVSAILHDVGYTVIPPVFFEDKEQNQEYLKIFKMHPTIAVEKILKPAGIFDKYIPLIEDHHELLDGSGFPKAKKGSQINRGAQIISIVDSYCTLGVESTDSEQMDIEDIIDIFSKNSGIKWGSDIVSCFTSILADPKTRDKMLNSSNLNLSIN